MIAHTETHLVDRRNKKDGTKTKTKRITNTQNTILFYEWETCINPIWYHLCTQVTNGSNTIVGSWCFLCICALLVFSFVVRYVIFNGILLCCVKMLCCLHVRSHMVNYMYIQSWSHLIHIIYGLVLDKVEWRSKRQFG